CLLSAESRVLQIDVVHDLGERTQRVVAKLETLDQYLEGAAVALVRELAFIHIEPHLPVGGVVILPRDESESGLRIDEPPDEPPTRHAVDADPGAGDPHARPIVLRTNRRSRHTARHTTLGVLLEDFQRALRG